MAKNSEPFLRFLMRGVVIAAAAVVVFLMAAMLFLFYVLPDGWNE